MATGIENPLFLHVVYGQLISDRIIFLCMDNKGLTFYRQINLGSTKFVTGIKISDNVILMTNRQWSSDPTNNKAVVTYITLNQIIDNVYFTYPDFGQKLQAGLTYRFSPVVTGNGNRISVSFGASFALLLSATC